MNTDSELTFYWIGQSTIKQQQQHDPGKGYRENAYYIISLTYVKY